MTKTIGILTGGGDVPGLNPAIKSVVAGAMEMGYKVYGTRYRIKREELYGRNNILWRVYSRL